jgi:hypothetical protein
MRAHRVRALMGGQACVFYGAAEFSRDTDFAILADAANLASLRKALAELQAELIAAPPFAIRYLRRAHPPTRPGTPEQLWQVVAPRGSACSFPRNRSSFW